jgi:hypothetical protein
MIKTLSEQEAYAAMFVFLENRYKLMDSDDLGALLGSMSLLPSGGTVDPAIWEEWLAAIKDAKSGAARIAVELK